MPCKGDMIEDDEFEEEVLERGSTSDSYAGVISGEGGKGIPRGSTVSRIGDSGSLGEDSENDTVLDDNPKGRKEEKGGITS